MSLNILIRGFPTRVLSLGFPKLNFTPNVSLKLAFSKLNLKFFNLSQNKRQVKDFPFDTQCCEINFYSWAHTANQMIIRQFENKNITNTTHLAYNTEWVIYDTCALNKTIQVSNDLNWWVTSYIVYIKRESIYHVMLKIDFFKDFHIEKKD